MTPRPPSSAMAVAIRAPVTLSMLAETTGNSRPSRRERGVRSETFRRVLRGLSWGLSRKSSYVLPMNSGSRILIALQRYPVSASGESLLLSGIDLARVEQGHSVSGRTALAAANSRAIHEPRGLTTG